MKRSLAILMFFAAMMWALNTNCRNFFSHGIPQANSHSFDDGWFCIVDVIALPSAKQWILLRCIGRIILPRFLPALSIGIATYLWTIEVKRIGPAKLRTSIILFLCLHCFLYVFIGETLETLQFFGAAATIAGVWIARRENKNEVVE